MLSRISTSDRAVNTATTAIADNGDKGRSNGAGNSGSVVFYIVRKSWDKPKTQIAAFTKIEMAQNCVKCNPGYAAFDEAGNHVYPPVSHH